MAKKITIKGDIIVDEYKALYDKWGLDGTCPQDIKTLLSEAIKDNDSEIDLYINSGGGFVEAGVEMYTALMNYKGKINCTVGGLAASAATLPMVASDTVTMSAASVIMIHGASGLAWGNVQDFEKAIERLKNTNKSIANAYEIKTKLSNSELLKMMDKETWMDAKAAIEKGFADKILERQFTDKTDIEQAKTKYKDFRDRQEQIVAIIGIDKLFGVKVQEDKKQIKNITDEQKITAEFEYIKTKINTTNKKQCQR